LTGISSASVTSTAAVRAGSHSIALTILASRVSGPSGTVSTITHGTRSIDTECPDAGMSNTTVSHAGLPRLVLGGVKPRLAEQRVVVEPRDRAEERLGHPVLEHHLVDRLSSAGSSGRTRRARSPAWR